jgi:hypothetical protein
MNPADVEVVDLAQDANDRYYGNGPFSLGPAPCGVSRSSSRRP